MTSIGNQNGNVKSPMTSIFVSACSTIVSYMGNQLSPWYRELKFLFLDIDFYIVYMFSSEKQQNIDKVVFLQDLRPRD